MNFSVCVGIFTITSAIVGIMSFVCYLYDRKKK